MKVAGVKTGAERGEIIELSHPKKLEEALKMEISSLGDKDEAYKNYGTWARCIQIKDFSFTAQGQPLKGKWQNNVYSGSGTVEIHRRNRLVDRVVAPKKAEFAIKFEDCLDSWGMPDLKVTSLSLT